jgi:hypothetical protein
LVVERVSRIFWNGEAPRRRGALDVEGEDDEVWEVVVWDFVRNRAGKLVGVMFG